MTDIEKACKHRCARRPCKHICEYAALYVAGMNAGRKEREGEIKQVEKSWHDCFLSCSSPYCAVHFPAVEMQGELGNMSKREPEG